MKTCKKCNKNKEINEFYKNKAKKDGFDIYCKICNKENTLKLAQKYPEKHNKKGIRWRANNLEKSREM